jgi:hypothetical protein
VYGVCTTRKSRMLVRWYLSRKRMNAMSLVQTVCLEVILVGASIPTPFGSYGHTCAIVCAVLLTENRVIAE